MSAGELDRRDDFSRPRRDEELHDPRERGGYRGDTGEDAGSQLYGTGNFGGRSAYGNPQGYGGGTTYAGGYDEGGYASRSDDSGPHHVSYPHDHNDRGPDDAGYTSRGFHDAGASSRGYHDGSASSRGYHDGGYRSDGRDSSVYRDATPRGPDGDPDPRGSRYRSNRDDDRRR